MLSILGLCLGLSPAAQALEPMRLSVDVTDLEHRVFQVEASWPVQAGPLTLYYPQWLPGNHAPYGPVSELAGLRFFANGKALPWVRDTQNMFAFKLDVPPGVSRLEGRYQFLSPLAGTHGRVVLTPEILGLQWNTVVLYPAGAASDEIPVQANLKLPSEWQFGSALEVAGEDGATIRFKPTSLTNLVDSPVFAGKYVKKVALNADGSTPVTLNLFADQPDSLAIEPVQVEAHKELVRQAYKLFGPAHYQHYDFLVAMSNWFGRIGLEHTQSTEIGTRADLLTKWKTTAAQRTVIPHEFVHAWNGKFRRPQDLATPDFNVPMQNSLLWLYEGQTTYWTTVLATRAGFLSPQQARESLAQSIASLQQLPGRSWRSLRDTTNDPIIARRHETEWDDWQRSLDYYHEGALLWFDVDTRLRALTQEKISLDQFARAFFDVPGNGGKPVTYTFADVVNTLNALAPYDWAGFLNTRLDSHGPQAPDGGLRNSGWKLVFTDKANEFAESRSAERQSGDFHFSLGFMVGKNDQLSSVSWDSPAFKAGMSVGSTLVAVNGLTYKAENLKRVVTQAKTDPQAIEFLIKNNDHYRTVRIDYHGGLRYPHLEAVNGATDRLGAILTPLK
jgi:predicted metalloprotease with PDZ domain